MDHPLQISARRNLDLLALFHNHLSQLLHDARGIIGEEFEPEEAQRLVHLYENDFSRKLRNSVFLMVFGHLEEMLLHLLRLWTPDVYEQRSNGGILDRCSPMFIKVLGEDPDRKCPSLKYIKDASWVRNALMHSSGRVDLFKAKSLRGVVMANKNSYEIHLKRVSVTREGLGTTVREVRTLVDELSQGLK